MGRVAGVGVPALAAVEDAAVALPDGARLDPRGVAADVGLGDAERHHDLARRDLRQVLLLEPLGTVLDDGHRRKHVEVDRRGAAGAGAGRAEFGPTDGAPGPPAP